MIHIFDRFTIDTEYWQNFVQQASPSQYCNWGRIPVRQNTKAVLGCLPMHNYIKHILHSAINSLIFWRVLYWIQNFKAR